MSSESAAAVKYAGFWRRLAAFGIDGGIVLPIFALSEMWYAQSRLAHVYLAVPWLAFLWWYQVSLVHRFGGTPGKRTMNLRITMLDGSPITLRAARLRYAIDFLLSIVGTALTAVAALQVSDAAYAGLTMSERADLLGAQNASLESMVGWAFMLWVGSEFVVLLTNRKRRALHDFIAGTVVVVDPPSDPFTAAPPIAREPAS